MHIMKSAEGSKILKLQSARVSNINYSKNKPKLKFSNMKTW